MRKLSIMLLTVILLVILAGGFGQANEFNFDGETVRISIFGPGLHQFEDPNPPDGGALRRYRRRI